MQRREMIGKAVAGVAALAGGAVLGASPARADHRLVPAVHRLDNATEALLTTLVETAHHQNSDEPHESNDELLAVLAAGALQGQAHAIHALIEAGNPDANVRLAARELDRQMRVAQQRILHAHTTREARERFHGVRRAMDDFLDQAGVRGYGRGYGHDDDGYDDPRYRSRDERADPDHDEHDR